MASNNIEFRLASKFDGEGFTKASAAIAENRKEIMSSVRGLGELSNALGAISPQAGAAASGIASFASAFVTGGIVGGVIRLAIDGISLAIEKSVEWIKSFEERAKALADTLRNNFAREIGDSDDRLRSLSDEVQKSSQQLKDLRDVLNGNIEHDVRNKVYRLNIEKLQAVTDEMTEGGKAVVEAQFAMREATIKARAAVEKSYNNLEAANEEVVNAEKVLSEAEKRVAKSDVILADARNNEALDSEYFKNVQRDNVAAHKELEKATYNLKKARQNASNASDKVSEAEQDLDLITKTHEQKIREANKKLDEELIRKNELALKEEEAAAKWKEYLDGAFKREMNARNELAKKEEDASSEFKKYIDSVKKASGLNNDQSVDDYLDDLKGTLKETHKEVEKVNRNVKANASAEVNVKWTPEIKDIPKPKKLDNETWQRFQNGVANVADIQRIKRFQEMDRKYGLNDLNRVKSDFVHFLSISDKPDTWLSQRDSQFREDFKTDVLPQLSQDVAAKLLGDASKHVLTSDELTNVLKKPELIRAWLGSLGLK